MTGKERLSATVDADLIEVAQQAVAEGRADNVSAWVNSAMRRQAEDERRRAAWEAFLTDYERGHGVITEDEMAAAVHAARERAVVVRGKAGRRAAG